MKFTLLGTRGSRPVTHSKKFEFGGNTTSYKIEVDDFPAIYIDGGTGLFREGRRIAADMKSKKIKEFKAYFLVTHTHWDHILSFPFFKPFYKRNTSVKVYGPASSARNWDIKDLFNMQHKKGLFPVSFDNMKEKLEFVDVKAGMTFTLEERLQVSTYQLNHQGLTIGYRITDLRDGKSFAVVTDNAPVDNGNLLGVGMLPNEKGKIVQAQQNFTDGLVKFLKNCDLVIQDTHFTDDSIRGKENWGHSTPTMAVELNSKARVKTLILGHHAPEDEDTFTLKKWEEAQKMARETYQSDLKIVLVREQESLWV